MHVYISICMYYLSIYSNIYIYIYTYIYRERERAYTYIYIYIYIHIFVICIYTHTHSHMYPPDVSYSHRARWAHSTQITGASQIMIWQNGQPFDHHSNFWLSQTKPWEGEVTRSVGRQSERRSCRRQGIFVGWIQQWFQQPTFQRFTWSKQQLPSETQTMQLELHFVVNFWNIGCWSATKTRTSTLYFKAAPQNHGRKRSCVLSDTVWTSLVTPPGYFQKCTSNGIWRQGRVLKNMKTLQNNLYPVVICPHL